MKKRKGYNKVFQSLVQDDTDVAGLLAYGMYKYEKRQQIIEKEKKLKRELTTEEINSIVTIIGNKSHFDFYFRKAINLIDASAEYIEEEEEQQNEIIIKDNNQENKVIMTPNEETNSIESWIPKKWRPYLGVFILLTGGGYFAIPKAKVLFTNEEQCTKITVKGVIDSQKQNKITSVSIEKVSDAEDIKIVNGKFEFPEVPKPISTEITLLITYADKHTESISVPITNFKTNENCIMDLGHQKAH